MQVGRTRQGRVAAKNRPGTMVPCGTPRIHTHTHGNRHRGWYTHLDDELNLGNITTICVSVFRYLVRHNFVVGYLENYIFTDTSQEKGTGIAERLQIHSFAFGHRLAFWTFHGGWRFCAFASVKQEIKRHARKKGICNIANSHIIKVF